MVLSVIAVIFGMHSKFDAKQWCVHKSPKPLIIFTLQEQYFCHGFKIKMYLLQKNKNHQF